MNVCCLTICFLNFQVLCNVECDKEFILCEYNRDVDSTHIGPTLDARVPSRWLTKDSSPKNSQTNSSSPDLVQNSCSLHDYIAVYDSGLQRLDAGGDLLCVELISCV